MDTKQSKKLIIVNILRILERHSDSEHRLSQQDIIHYLKKDYDMDADRKAVKRNLANLIDSGYDIECTETARTNAAGEEETICTDWYLERQFDDSELRLLIDGLLFSKHIPYSQCKDLISRLKGLSSEYFDAKVDFIRGLPESRPENKQLFYTISTLDEAMSQNKQVSFTYLEYDIDKQLHPRKREDGSVREYIINPYQIVATNGRYYLIGNYDKYDAISHYRLDKIKDVTCLDTSRKPVNKVTGCENGLNLPTHMAEHIYMFSGPNERVRFRADRSIIGNVIDWLGTDLSFSNANGQSVDVTVTVNLDSIFFWMLQYGEHVEVLEPQSLRERVAKAVAGMNEKYNSAGVQTEQDIAPVRVINEYVIG